MEKLKLANVLRNAALRKRIVGAMKSGRIFVYPTDTIYGIGCNAENAPSVEKIRNAKGRDEGKTFSVIAPGKEWIWSHADVTRSTRDMIDKLLPGPYTIILKANSKTPKPVLSPERSIGVRMPRHPFTALVEESGVPFVTTSVNIKGQPPVKSTADIQPEIRSVVDIVIDAGIMEGFASRVFDMRTDDIRVVRR
jgi:tRNA threonylcarbamoyl adenosine modification protein (Sua5/YciO/YrdC/YwlC family)